MMHQDRHEGRPTLSGRKSQEWSIKIGKLFRAPIPKNAEDEMINVSNFDKRRTYCTASSQIFKKSMPLEIT